MIARANPTTPENGLARNAPSGARPARSRNDSSSLQSPHKANARGGSIFFILRAITDAPPDGRGGARKHFPRGPVYRRTELTALLVTDAAAFFLATLLYNAARFRWDLLGAGGAEPAYLVVPSLLVAAYWMLVMFFFGMYRERYATSRFDELVALLKTATVGILVLFMLLFFDNMDAPGKTRTRENILFYWMAVLLVASAGRILVRSVQKALILRGYGTHRALIVGWGDRVEQLYQDVSKYPEAGLNVVGAIRMDRDDPAAERTLRPGSEGDGLAFGGAAPVLTLTTAASRSITELPRLIDELGVQDVLIALGSEDHEALFQVLHLCDGKSVSLKLVPDFYTIIGGMARTEHIYGLPLIEVLPEPMPAWEQSTKRLLDVLFSAVVLLGGLPVWLFVAALIRLTSPGPSIYRQQRVGQHGRTFTMYKFRTMRRDAEAATGPVWAREDDPRYTPIGRFLRKTRLDEAPQLWNVLRNEMSLVGPRPERPFFVEQLAEEIPLYRRRHRVKPGITGWAQVKWKYDESLEDVRQKVKYDLFYIENMSLRMDLKILFRTFRTAVGGSGR